MQQGHGRGPDLPLEEASLAARPRAGRARSRGASQVAEPNHVRNGTVERRGWGSPLRRSVAPVPDNFVDTSPSLDE